MKTRKFVMISQLSTRLIKSVIISNFLFIDMNRLTD